MNAPPPPLSNGQAESIARIVLRELRRIDAERDTRESGEGAAAKP
jgi:hypothetical protein